MRCFSQEEGGLLFHQIMFMLLFSIRWRGWWAFCFCFYFRQEAAEAIMEERDEGSSLPGQPTQPSHSSLTLPHFLQHIISGFFLNHEL